MRGNDDCRALNALLLLTLLAVSLSTAASAQNVRLSAGAVLPVSGQLGPEWTARPGIGGQILLPMYGGETRLSLDLASHQTDDDAFPELTALNATLGWGPVLALGPLRLTPGAEIGAGRFSFDDDGQFGGNLASESELIAGGYLRLGGRVGGPVEAWAEAGVRRTFFSTIATTATASAGLAVRL